MLRNLQIVKLASLLEERKTNLQERETNLQEEREAKLQEWEAKLQKMVRDLGLQEERGEPEERAANVLPEEREVVKGEKQSIDRRSFISLF